MDKRGKRINAREIEEASNSFVFVEPPIAEDAVTLSNNLFRNERKN